MQREETKSVSFTAVPPVSRNGTPSVFAEGMTK